MITKAERSELRSLIRQRFKVLRAEVAVRQAELAAELERHIVERFASAEKRWSDTVSLIAEATMEANRRANDILRGHMGGTWTERRVVDHVVLGNPNTDERAQLRRQGVADIEARVRSAMLSLDQQEADLLTRLVTGALESAEARAFLAEIPTVSALVPSVRLRELERSLREPGTEAP